MMIVKLSIGAAVEPQMNGEVSHFVNSAGNEKPPPLPPGTATSALKTSILHVE